jgi:hypothetical protein
MTRHIYSVGQQVSFGGRVVTYLKRTGVFTITKLLPPLGAALQYRIKSAGEAHERVASAGRGVGKADRCSWTAIVVGR